MLRESHIWLPITNECRFLAGISSFRLRMPFELEGCKFHATLSVKYSAIRLMVHPLTMIQLAYWFNTARWLVQPRNH